MEALLPVHAADDAAGGREETGTVMAVVGGILKGDPFRLKPLFQLLEGDRQVNQPVAVLLDLILFGDAGPDKDDMGVGILLFDELGVGVHRGVDRRVVVEALGMVFLDQPGDRMAAGGDNQLLPAGN